jgi:hypothetical protein
VVVKSFITFGSAVPNLRFIHFSVAACKSDIFNFVIIIFSLLWCQWYLGSNPWSWNGEANVLPLCYMYTESFQCRCEVKLARRRLELKFTAIFMLGTVGRKSVERQINSNVIYFLSRIKQVYYWRVFYTIIYNYNYL